ncbi:MAG: hypothetical protein KatS3mg129_2408 [Leptospiraceae bacterium]|nr:MAG: hypothetical protein KatS3mg129_2408 [Leptospiraceae bacterium]
MQFYFQKTSYNLRGIVMTKKYFIFFLVFFVFSCYLINNNSKKQKKEREQFLLLYYLLNLPEPLTITCEDIPAKQPTTNIKHIY